MQDLFRFECNILFMYLSFFYFVFFIPKLKKSTYKKKNIYLVIYNTKKVVTFLKIINL